MTNVSKRTADFSSMAEAMRACCSWTPVSPLDDEAHAESRW